jgi:hypothetical protein
MARSKHGRYTHKQIYRLKEALAIEIAATGTKPAYAG